MPDPAIRVRDIPVPSPGWHNHAYAVFGDGRLGLMRINRDFTGQPPQDQDWHDSGLRCRLTAFDGLQEILVAELPAFRWPCFDLLPGGDIVVVEARGRDNAHIFAADGTAKAQFDVGDGVQHIVATPDNRIWVGYFDEGIFGTEERPDGSWPPASSGLAAFTTAGDCVWQAPHTELTIHDCYALTATSNDIWLCPYSNFPVAKVSADKVLSWKNDIAAQAIAVSGNAVILVDAFPPHLGTINLLALGDTATTKLSEMRLDLTTHAHMVGRDGMMNIVDGDRWQQISAADWAAA